MSASSSRPSNARAAALAAAEARLKPPAIPLSEAELSDPSPTSPPTTPLPQPTSSSGLSGSTRSNGKSAEVPWVPTEKEDKELRMKFSRLLDRGIVRDNGYRDAASAVETLITITSNLIQHNEPKYRDLKASNSTLKNKVLAVKGGHDYLIALGFRTQTIDFTLHYILHPTLKRMHEFKLGAEVLQDHLASLQSRASLSTSSKTLASSDEAARKARALREIEADREDVKDRVEREKRMRDRQERLSKEQEEKQKMDEIDNMRMEVPGGIGGADEGDIPGGMMLGAGTGGAGAMHHQSSDTEDGDGDDGDDDAYHDDETWGTGQALGS